MVRVVLLWVDVPDEGLACPEGPDQRVFAAHKVEVAGPEHFVKAVLARVGQGAPVGLRGHARQRLLHCRQRTAGGDEQVVRRTHQLIQQLGQCGRFVAEQADQQAIRGQVGGMLLTPGSAVKALLPCQQVGFAQQAARAGREAGVKEGLGPALGRAAHDG